MKQILPQPFLCASGNRCRPPVSASTGPGMLTFPGLACFPDTVSPGRSGGGADCECDRACVAGKPVRFSAANPAEAGQIAPNVAMCAQGRPYPPASSRCLHRLGQIEPFPAMAAADMAHPGASAPALALHLTGFGCRSATTPPGGDVQRNVDIGLRGRRPALTRLFRAVTATDGIRPCAGSGGGWPMCATPAGIRHTAPNRFRIMPPAGPRQPDPPRRRTRARIPRTSSRNS